MQWWCAAQDVAWSWSWRPYPGVWLFVGMLLAGYVALFRRYPDEEGPGGFSRWARMTCAGLGLALLWIALDWPVGALGAGYLASVHMVQYLLIAVSAPPLLLLGIPRPALEALVRRPVPGALAHRVGHPLPALALFTVVQAFTHWPPAADGLMATQWGNFLLDLMWLGAGLLFWWPVAVALPERSWLTEPFKMGYLIAATLVNTGVFAYLTFAELPLYATFELAPPVGFLSTRDDQLVAGLLMKIGGAVVLWTSITILFVRWYRRSTEEDARPAGSARAALALLLALAACGGDAANGPDLRVSVAVVSEPVTGERAALYVEIENRGAAADTLTGVTVEGVGRTSLHRTTLENGMMRMESAAAGLPVPAGGTLRMAPGGVHVMLEELAATFEVGSFVAIELTFARGGVVGDSATVVPLARLEEALSRRR